MKTIISFKLAAALSFAFLVFGLFSVTRIIKADKNFPITEHRGHDGGYQPDGRYVAAYPDEVTVQISPSYAWERADGKARLWYFVSLLFVALAALYAGAAIAEVIPKINPIFFFLALVFAAASLLAAYSSRFVSNSVRIERTRFDRIKDQPDSLKSLFDKKLIK